MCAPAYRDPSVKGSKCKLLGRERFANWVQVPRAPYARLSAACATPAQASRRHMHRLDCSYVYTKYIGTGQPTPRSTHRQQYYHTCPGTRPLHHAHLIGNLRSPFKAETRAPSAMPTTKTKLVARPRPNRRGRDTDTDRDGRTKIGYTHSAEGISGSGQEQRLQTRFGDDEPESWDRSHALA